MDSMKRTVCVARRLTSHGIHFKKRNTRKDDRENRAVPQEWENGLFPISTILHLKRHKKSRMTPAERVPISRMKR
ncbi:hypothetical protein [Bilophila wadsworthia]|uniref:hypothetical protein n=1 Tax=Bilophila wadsworthia TaxID=35833 RepID=UPI002666E20B|nr:hypothetical protein [Bilophila wadsworthia]